MVRGCRELAQESAQPVFKYREAEVTMATDGKNAWEAEYQRVVAESLEHTGRMFDHLKSLIALNGVVIGLLAGLGGQVTFVHRALFFLLGLYSFTLLIASLKDRLYQQSFRKERDRIRREYLLIDHELFVYDTRWKRLLDQIPSYVILVVASGLFVLLDFVLAFLWPF
jgi:hypothetical protein